MCGAYASSTGANAVWPERLNGDGWVAHFPVGNRPEMLSCEELGVFNGDCEVDARWNQPRFNPNRLRPTNPSKLDPMIQTNDVDGVLLFSLLIAVSAVVFVFVPT